MALRQWPYLLLANSNRSCEDRVSSRMRHQKKTIKLGRTADHRRALLANQVCALIQHQRIKTTLAKAKAVRPLAERMVTLGKNGSIHARRRAGGSPACYRNLLQSRGAMSENQAIDDLKSIPSRSIT